MIDEQVRAALGSQYRFVQQTDPRFSSLTYLAAYGGSTAYSATLINGIVSAFNYVDVFDPSSQPLQTNLVDGITAKSWAPIFNRPPYRVFWVTDAQGRPRLKPLPDSSIHPCAHINGSGFGPPPREAAGAAGAMLQRILPRDNGPGCGVTISLSMQPSPSNNGTAASLTVSATNDLSFHEFMSVVNAASQQKQKAEHDKLNSVPTPF